MWTKGLSGQHEVVEWNQGTVFNTGLKYLLESYEFKAKTCLSGKDYIRKALKKEM